MRSPEGSVSMQFILTGFTQESGFRVYAFERVISGSVRTVYRVRADLDLVRRYGIRTQELPLLCRSLLDKTNEGGEQRTFTFTEEDMRVRAKESAAAGEAKAHRRKPPRRPSGENAGSAWRLPQA